MAKEYPLFEFEGFPGFGVPELTQVPDVVFDQIAPRLGEAELRVLLYIIRHTYGYKKPSDSISLTQITDGITKRTGEVLDIGAGVGRKAAYLAIRGLEEKRLITVERGTITEKGNEPNRYTLRMKSAERWGPTAPRGGGLKSLGLGAVGTPQDPTLQDHQQKDREWGKTSKRRPKGTDPDAYFLGPFARLIQG